MMKLKEPCSTRHCLIRRDPNSHGYLFTLNRDPEVRGGFSARLFDRLPDRVDPPGDPDGAFAFWARIAAVLGINPDALRACYDLIGDALGGESTDPQDNYPCPPVPPGLCIPGCVRDDPHARARCMVPAPAPQLGLQCTETCPVNGMRCVREEGHTEETHYAFSPRGAFEWRPIETDDYAGATTEFRNVAMVEPVPSQPSAVARELPSVAKRRSDLLSELRDAQNGHFADAAQYAAHGQRIAVLEKTIATITEANRWQSGRVVELENELAESRKSAETQIAALEASLTIQRDAVKNREVEIEALEACNERQNRQMDNLRRMVGVEHFGEGIAATPPPRPAVIHCQSQVDPDE